MTSETPKVAKLSEPQQDLLRALADGSSVSFHPYMGRFNPNAYYSLHIEGQGFYRVTAQATALLRRGYATRIKERPYNDGHELEITEAGRAALASQEKPE